MAGNMGVWGGMPEDFLCSDVFSLFACSEQVGVQSILNLGCVWAFEATLAGWSLVPLFAGS